MKLIITFIILSISGTDLFAQSDSLLKFIFVPHPRSEDRTNQSVYPGILNIDFTNYDVRMLGGDITYSTSKDSATLAYCDNLFNIGSPNTLWSLGNHDVQSGNRSLIKKFTGRESFYSYGRDGVTFIVLDTELDANGFANTFIKDEQLQMVQSVCDSITESSVLILLLHRFMWMINNDYFKTMLTDSIAASSRSMDTTNFYSDIYPLLQEVKNKGIKVLVFGGDKSKINIAYSPEDSITFYAARLADDLPDSINNVIILDYNLRSKKITYNFIPLSEMIASVVQEPSQLPLGFALSQNYPNPFNPTTNIEFYIPGSGFVSLKVYDILGGKVAILVDEYMPGGNYKVELDGSGLSSGVYFYRLQFMPDGKYTDRFTDTKKFILLK
jgi:hypothetical protein